MALNRYRLKHLAEHENRAALRAQKLLDRPDRLIGLILLGNNFVNILAAQIATLLTIRFVGEDSLFISGLILTAVILVFAEVVPKTMAAARPESIAFPSSLLLRVLLFVFFPIVWVLNTLSNRILSFFGVTELARTDDPLNREELRTVVKEAGAMISTKHRQMLFGILDLEKATVEDIIVPRNEVYGIDLEDEWPEVMEQLAASRHSRIPCYFGSLDEIKGVLHLRKIAKALRAGDNFQLDDLVSMLDAPYFVPLKTDLYIQLLNFQNNKQRIAIVVDEYGDIEGLVTLEDLLAEVIGEFTTDPQFYTRDVYPQEDGSFLVDGSANIREINRLYRFGLATDGPKTINGLIIETLEDIPETGTTFKLGTMTIEIVQTLGHAVKTARLTITDAPHSDLPTGSVEK